MMLRRSWLINRYTLIYVSRKKRRNQGRGGYGRQEGQMFPAVCATCGKDTMVPFQPSGEKPVYCRECFVPPTRNNW